MSAVVDAITLSADSLSTKSILHHPLDKAAICITLSAAQIKSRNYKQPLYPQTSSYNDFPKRFALRSQLVILSCACVRCSYCLSKHGVAQRDEGKYFKKFMRAGFLRLFLLLHKKNTVSHPSQTTHIEAGP